uniref:Amine oxidase domain-containing protein n=1 Tax=Eutreptiella gymnastica TaxID=73025 RepID=A0A7S1I1J0_9EUGL
MTANHPPPSIIDAPVKVKGAKKVLVIGAGAAGMAAAWSLARFPEKFIVEVWDPAPCAGGVATSVDVLDGVVVNDGVQGGATSYRNTLLMHEKLGAKPTPVHMKISFGKGQDQWGNYGTKTDLVRRLQPEIKRFEKVLRWIGKLEPLFIGLPISLVLKTFRFSKDFQDKMVLPLVALFFGTGNQTGRVSSVLFARVFTDPHLRLFDYDAELLLSQTPQMFAFQPLREIYQKYVDAIAADFHFGRQAVSVVRNKDGVEVRDASGEAKVFDEVIFAGNAEAMLKILTKPSWMEKRVLGNVQYFNDITITHTDLDYMKRHYDIDLNDTERNDQYFIKTYESDSSKVEMSFLLNNYQPHVRGSALPIFQTIFLDDERQDLWTINEIQEDKILLRKWWRQFAHTWKHFLFTVPLMRFLQGKQHSWYCGAYTLANTHEIATISGLAVAERLGAPYPFRQDPLAALQFDIYMKYLHGK